MMLALKKAATLLLLLLLTGLAHAASLVGSPAPDALGIDKDNRAIHVSDYRGKVVVLTFWASWCGYCLKELPVLENLQRKVGSDQIAVVAINTDKDHDKYRTMRRRMKDFQLTLTADGKKEGIAEAYGVSGLPHMVLVDKQGRVAYIHIGYSEDALPRFVYEINLLLEQAPETPVAANN